MSTVNCRFGHFHQVRVLIACLYCAILIACSIIVDHPAVLLTLLGSCLAVAYASGAFRVVLRAMLWAIPFATLVVVINALVVRDGVTVIFYVGTLPGFGRVDITAEACIYGVVLGVRTLVIIAISSLFTAVIDADKLVRSLKFLPARIVLTVAVALRLIPLLMQDARRLAIAQRCVGNTSKGYRLAIFRAIIGSALERSIDLAATLEVRGIGVYSHRKSLSRPRVGLVVQRVIRLSRIDMTFLGCSLIMVLLISLCVTAGISKFAVYPTLSVSVTSELILVLVLLFLSVTGPWISSFRARLDSSLSTQTV